MKDFLTILIILILAALPFYLKATEQDNHNKSCNMNPEYSYCK